MARIDAKQKTHIILLCLWHLVGDYTYHIDQEVDKR